MNYKKGDILITIDDWYYPLRKIKYIGKVYYVDLDGKAYLKTMYTSTGDYQEIRLSVDSHFMKLNEAIQKGLGYES